jgi:hypothetical protein
MSAYQEQLKALGLEGLGVKPLPHPTGRQFVGSETCGECHVEEYEIWEKTPHAHAMDSLVHPGERSEIPRHYDPECLSCHVTGWNPQKFYPYDSGYLGLKETPEMMHVGCENCHGPGSAHVDDSENVELQREMILAYERAEQKCIECHDLDNSPDFHKKGAFEDTYWPKVAHGKKWVK